MSLEMSTLVTYAKTKGFVYQGSEIYGGLANSWDYGPLGALLKENIKNLWIKEFVQKRKDMVLLDASIMMNPNVWVASGHVGGFSDPLIDNKDSNIRYRADKLIEENGDINPDGLEIHKFRDYFLSRWSTSLTERFAVKLEDLKSQTLNLKKTTLNQEIKLLQMKQEILENHGLEIYNSIEKKANQRIANSQRIDPMSVFLERFNQVDPLLIEVDEFEIVLKLSLNEFMAYILRQFIACPKSGTKNWTEIKNFNLMLSTRQGVVDGEGELVYLRPETAQGIFVNFPNIARSSRKKIPFGVAQCGKAFRNEITPKNFIFRTREFEQIEIEYFCKPGTDAETFEQWLVDEGQFFTIVLGFKSENVRFVEIPAEGLPHYSKRAGDFEYLFPFGWGEISTLANRTDYDLGAHMKHSGADLSYFDPYDNTKYLPYVIEPSIGLSRLTLAAMCDAYAEVPGEEGTSKVVMRFAPQVAPIKVGVFPLVKKFSESANELYSLLSAEFMCEYDEAGTIGKRYQRADEIGIPYSICVEPENYDQGQVTVRDRDTGEQEMVQIDELVSWLKRKGC